MSNQKNKNGLFLLPIYERSLKFYGRHFRNLYIDRKSSNKLIFVFESEPKQEVLEFLTKNENFLSMKIEGEEAIFVLKVPEHFVKDINLYRRGKYSKLSKTMKQQIIAMNPEHTYDLNIVLFPKDEDREALAKRLNAELPKDSEVFDIIGESEYYNEKPIRTELE